MFPRFRPDPGRGYFRHVSRISLSFASVFVISENSFSFSPNAAPTPLPAASRTARSLSESLFNAAETVSSSSPTRTFIPATVSSNSRDHAPRPVTSVSCSSFSSASSSGCGRNTRKSRNQGRHFPAAGSASFASSAASSSRFISSVKKIRWLEIPVTRSVIDW